MHLKSEKNKNKLMLDITRVFFSLKVKLRRENLDTSDPYHILGQVALKTLIADYDRLNKNYKRLDYNILADIGFQFVNCLEFCRVKDYKKVITYSAKISAAIREALTPISNHKRAQNLFLKELLKDTGIKLSSA